MRLSELLNDVEIEGIAGDPSIDVASVTTDSRACEPGSLFIAIRGFSVDGSDFVDSALKKGAVAVVAEKPLRIEAVTVQTRNARAAAARIAAAFHGHPSRRLSLIGVTGTSGKTTTSRMIESILEATGKPVGLIGTIEYRAGALREIADRTTPDSIVLQQWLARMVEAGVPRAVMEVSSHALALERTLGIEFAAAVFTNLSRDHFDFHHDFEDYFAAKKVLFDQIDRAKRTAVVNAGDPWGLRLIAELGPAALTFGEREDADIHPAAGFTSDLEELSGVIRTPWGDVALRSSLVGSPNLSNWMAAIGAALVAGIDIPLIEQGIRTLAAVRGRFERVPSSRGTVLVDYAHKPDALEKLLRAIRAMAPDRKITLIFGCGGDRDQGKRPMMGEIAGRFADFTILTSDNPRSEPPEAIIDQIEEGIARVGGARWARLSDRRAAIEQGIASIDEGTVVVIAGKGHENYQVVGDRIIHFDDLEEAELAIEKQNEILDENHVS
ncbi:MAG TPA: UDP-N-acetylmuramoyl-L-alanyl-D-glutamate--2,6-diaminopimelate ligase [Thermoanaerobaculia bacterium]|nr:UDP-N-acetylmuramoyl-L-alanyl-D-glutamate--2,6-diaminopimelate ligase [Thermoanaerobaculia bacterium]